MGGDVIKAASVLEALLSVDGTVATRATAHFAASMKADPSFMMRAMGLRGAVERRDVGEVARQLEGCFALGGDEARAAASALLARYP